MAALPGNVFGDLLLLPLQVATVLVVGGLVRRLLGVRVGLVRMTLAGVLALWIAGLLLETTVGADGAVDPASAVLSLLLAACLGSLLAMAVLVVAGVLVPEGSLPAPLAVWRGWRGRSERARRYGQVLHIAVRHGLGRFLRGRRHAGLDGPSSGRELARSLRRALDEGGVAFVKLGQQLSTRRDLLPPVFVSELARLQDAATPVAWPRIEAALERDLGCPPWEAFQTIDPEPIASASIAQIHAARLHDGAEVVVKVRRPDIDRLVERDLDIMRRLAQKLESRTEWGAGLGLDDLAAGFAAAVREELDLTTERDNMRHLAASLEAVPRRGVRIPAPVDGLCGPRVLVMERMRGRPLGSCQSLLDALDPDVRRRSAAQLLDSILDQVLIHGMFHVDLHPGNVLVQADGTLELLDFGSVGRLDSRTRATIGHFMAALARGDSVATTDTLLDLVDRPEHVDERELERSVGQLVVRYAVPGSRASAAAFPALLRLVMTHRLRIPPEVAAVFRTFATLEGTLTLLDPDFDLVANAQRSGRERMSDAMRPRQVRQAVEDELLSLLPMLRRLPRRMDRIAGSLEHGRLTANVRLFADARDRRWITDLVDRTLLTLLAGTTGVMAALLLAIDGGPRLTEAARLFEVLGYGLLVVAGVLGLRVLVLVLRPWQP